MKAYYTYNYPESKSFKDYILILRNSALLFFLVITAYNIPGYAQAKKFGPQENGISSEYNYGNGTNVDSNLTYIGHFGWGPCLAVASKGNYIYTGNGSLIHILDMTNPSSPILVNEVDHVGLVEDFVVRGYLLFSLNPLQIFDITDPVNPKRLYLSDKWAGYELLVDSNFVYIPNYIVIYMIDISNPEEPALAGEIYPPGFTTDVAKYKNYLYNNTGDAIFVDIWDISDKTNPVEVGRTGQLSIKEDLKIEGDYLYISPIEIWDLSEDPANPELISDYFYPEFPFDPSEIEIADTLMYAAMLKNGLSVINIKDKANPYEIERLDWIGYPSESLGPWQIDINKGIIYSAATSGLWTINIVSDGSLSNSSFYNTGSTARDIIVEGNYGYGAFSSGGLIIINIENPAQPKFVSQMPTWGGALKIDVKENVAILGTNENILFIDLNDKNNPIEIGKIPGKYAFTMSIKDSLVLCGSDSSNIRIINYSDPYNPFIQKEFTATKFPSDLALYKNYIYSAEEYNGIRIYDISTENPVEVNSITNESGLGVLVRNNLLYAAMGGELRIYNIENPVEPILTGYTNTPGARSSRVELDMDKNDSSYLYMSYGYNIEVINITDKTVPFIAAYFRGDLAAASGIDIHSKYIFASQRLQGLNVYKTELITSTGNNKKPGLTKDFELYQNYPNPFNSSTTISYYLPEADLVNIKIYDVLGREVFESPSKKYIQAGKHYFHFNKNNLSSGIYYITVETTNRRKTIKIMLLK